MAGVGVYNLHFILLSLFIWKEDAFIMTLIVVVFVTRNIILQIL